MEVEGRRDTNTAMSGYPGGVQHTIVKEDINRKCGEWRLRGLMELQVDGALKPRLPLGSREHKRVPEF